MACGDEAYRLAIEYLPPLVELAREHYGTLEVQEKALEELEEIGSQHENIFGGSLDTWMKVSAEVLKVMSGC